MSIFGRLFGGEEPQQPKRGEEDKIAFSRSSSDSAGANPGNEQQEFIKGVATVLGCEPSQVNLDARLVEDMGLEDLDVSEFVQIAEETWRVPLMPNPMNTSDYAQMLKSFPTLRTIISTAEAKRK